VAVIGGGVGGAAAALRLARAGRPVTLCEAGSNLGGLLVSFELGGTWLECFYHHIFPHETAIQQLISEVGLADDLDWLEAQMGMFARGRIWPFTSGLDLLRFGPLPPVDRLRTGLGALRVGRVRSWEGLDELPAQEWLAGYTGRRSVEEIWGPLLAAKFGPAAPSVPAAWMWGRLSQRAGARGGGDERLGYLRGGFRRLFDALHGKLEAEGVRVRTDTPARSVTVEQGRARGVETDDGRVPADAVLFAGALPRLSGLVPDEWADPRWSAIGGLGVLVVVVETTRPITDCYWTNVVDAALPFGGLVEHTNLVPAADYGGRHLVYLSRYFTHDEAVAAADPHKEAQRWIDALAERLAGFSRDDVVAVHPFRTGYAAPLVQLGHASRIPPMASHLPGLYLATTAQIYPADRGMDEGVRLGRRAAEQILADADGRSQPRATHTGTGAE
jgi:protoporphyrinogen oxidase